MSTQKHFKSILLAAWGIQSNSQTENMNCKPVKFGPEFLYNGVPAPDDWVQTFDKTSEDETREIFMLTQTSPDGKLTLENQITIFKDFPAVEWLPILRCIGNEPSGIVSKFNSLSLEQTIISPTKKIAQTRSLKTPFAGLTPIWDNCYPHHAVRIRRNYGVYDVANDFLPADVVLYDRPEANSVTMNCHEGRCSSTWLPFFGLDISDREGINVAIGWTGRWQAKIELPPEDHWNVQGVLTAKAGMMNTHFRVLPGEAIRQPSILLHFRSDLSVADGQNQFRQLILKHHTPLDSNGKSISTPRSFLVWGGWTNNMLMEANDKLAKLKTGYDTFWIDAGWYGPDREVSITEYDKSDWGWTVGDWRVNQVPHPGGFKAFSDAVHKNNMKFLLWVEIERVMRNTPVSKEHPEWFFDNPQSDQLLLNFGHQQTRQWAIDIIDRLVREEGIDYYRQDFNFQVQDYWDASDAEDRQGISEAKHIAGLYQFWDAIRKLHPNLIIDNCASGGRRIDFETISRSFCLWRNDIIGRPWFDASDLCQTQIAYLTQWVPLHAGGVTLLDGDDYAYLSCVSSGFSCMGNFSDGQWLSDITTTARRMTQYFNGNFYLLTQNPEDYKNYCAYQCHDPQSNSGFVIVFRRRETISDEVILYPGLINSARSYQVEHFRHGTKTVCGKELSEMKISNMKPRSVELFFYTIG
jgi:alpha-galactosidase